MNNEISVMLNGGERTELALGTNEEDAQNKMDKALFNGWRVWRKSFVLGEKKSILRGLIFRIHKIRGILDNEKDQIIQTLLMNFSKGNFKYTSKYSWWWGVLKKWVYLEYRFLFCPFSVVGWGFQAVKKKKKPYSFFKILNIF